MQEEFDEIPMSNFELSISVDEAKELWKALRKTESENSRFLNNLELKIMNYLSNNISIEEAEEFFNEN